MFIIKQLLPGESAEVNVSKVVDNPKGFIDLVSADRKIPDGLYHPPTGTMIIDKSVLVSLVPPVPADPAPVVVAANPKPSIPPPPTK